MILLWKNFASYYKVSGRCVYAIKIRISSKWKRRSMFDQSSLKLSNKVMDYLYYCVYTYIHISISPYPWCAPFHSYISFLFRKQNLAILVFISFDCLCFHKDCHNTGSFPPDHPFHMNAFEWKKVMHSKHFNHWTSYHIGVHTKYRNFPMMVYCFNKFSINI